jgi:hypothetical protein
MKGGMYEASEDELRWVSACGSGGYGIRPSSRGLGQAFCKKTKTKRFLSL